MSQSVLDRPALDFEAARHRMVDAQIRPNQINDPRIIAEMRGLPREACVPPELHEFAYADNSLALGEGRVLTEPRVIARLLQTAVPQEGERALVLAAGTGYAAALLAGLGLSVTALEDNARLAAIGRSFCAASAPGVRWVEGPLEDGAESFAPFDLIVIDGAVREIPPALSAQLAPGGRIAGIASLVQGGVAFAFVARLEGAEMRLVPQFDAAVPMLPQLAPVPAFSF